jgi:uncharacterized protein (DUF2147 family)
MSTASRTGILLTRLPARMADMKRLVLACLLTCLSGLALAADPTGLWLTKKGDVAVALAACPDETLGDLCGTIHWLRADVTQIDPNGKPLCGVQVLKGFKADPSKADRWINGTLFVADKGNTYRSQLTLTAPDRLEMRAYIGTPLVGKTKTLRRVSSADYPSCTATAAK